MNATTVEILRRTREAKGWSQARLAREANLDQPYISRLERGEFPNVETATLERIAAALGLRMQITFVAATEDAATTAA